MKTAFTILSLVLSTSIFAQSTGTFIGSEFCSGGEQVKQETLQRVRDLRDQTITDLEVFYGLKCTEGRPPFIRAVNIGGIDELFSYKCDKGKIGITIQGGQCDPASIKVKAIKIKLI